MVNIQSRSHRRLAKFVTWIKPDSDTRDDIKQQADEIRNAIKGQASRDGLSIIATPHSGSFAKHTGLRRHMRGNDEIEGQDVDLPFVVKPLTADGGRITELLQRFEKYAGASYPKTPRKVTKSSVELGFDGGKLNYDLVPMLPSGREGYEIILKSDGTRRLTSVEKHTDFVKRRTAESDALPGCVKFNECVRLVKWWRCIRLTNASSIDKVPTVLLELLCAKAYDRFKVEATYPETLLKWFGLLASITAQRMRVAFEDYQSIEPFKESPQYNSLWQVIDPVNASNNVVRSNWGNIELSEFAEWFAQSRDSLQRLIVQDGAGNDGNVDNILSELFGSAVISHGELV